MAIKFLPGDVSVNDIGRTVLAAGSGEVVGPIEQPRNVREITQTDPDGYRLRFSEPIDLTKSFDDMMGEADSQG